MPRPRRPKNDSHFVWQESDVVWIPAQKPVTPLGDELHTILWSLEHVSNQATFSDVMLNVAHYLADHPGDPLVTAAIHRVEQRLEHAT